MIKGIDISVHQGAVDLDAIKRDCDFAIIRAGYGGGGLDKQLARNRDGLRQRGVPLGFYFFAYPGRSSGRSQAEEFHKYVGGLQRGEFVALDIENEPNYGRNLVASDVQWSLEFLQRCEELFGIKPLVYMDGGVKSKFDWSPVVKGNYGLWIAHWGRNNGQVDSEPSASPWPFWAIHQYTSKANMGGISPVDANRFNGTVAQLRKYGKGTGDPVTPPPVTPTPQPKPQPSTGKYTVKSGDVLSAIAAKYGMPWKTLWNYGNNRAVIGPNPNIIYPGQVLDVPGSTPAPGPQPTYYTVRKGNSLSTIGGRFGVSVDQLVNWNAGKYPSLKSNRNLIYPGWVLRVK